MGRLNAVTLLGPDMNFKSFIKQSGFKVLALARLNECEYSLFLYLLNCSVSGLDDLVTTDNELASLIGVSQQKVQDALENLSTRQIIRLHYGETLNRDSQSLRLGIQFNMKKWQLDYDSDVTVSDAVVFPFRRRATPNLSIVNPQVAKVDPEKTQTETWRRVLTSFVQGRSFDDTEIEMAEENAKVLVQTHPVDQVLLFIRHFGKRIPTLSLLASAWYHYQEQFEEETQKIDLLEARQKHSEQDQQVREQAQLMLAASDELGLSEDERIVLEVLSRHRHPRRQLFWAYQMRMNYPNLDGFFRDNAGLMLPVTSGGQVVRKAPENP
jgi:hypothetical protein